MPLLPSREALARCRILVVGDVMLDRYWHGSVDRISPEAPVPIVLVRRQEERLGGAANVALNVKCLGGAVTLLTMTGQDEAAQTLKTLLDAQGIRHVACSDVRLQTTVKLRVIGQAQQLIRLDFESAPVEDVHALFAEAFARELERHDWIVFSDYAKGCLAQVGALIAMAREAGKTVLVDPKGVDYQRYAGAQLITPNRVELAQVTGRWHDEDDLTARVETLRQSLGLNALLLTRSEQGMSLFAVEGRTDVAAQAREVFDVTGAGDVVIATLAVMLGAGCPSADAMCWANRAAGIAVSKFGTATVSYEELAA